MDDHGRSLRFITEHRCGTVYVIFASAVVASG
jgi:hypothetical protein